MLLCSFSVNTMSKFERYYMLYILYIQMIEIENVSFLRTVISMLVSTFDPERKDIGVYILEFYTNQFTESTSMEEINAYHEYFDNK